MAVIDERYRSARDVGAPAIGSYLAAFVKEREAMNAEAEPDTKGLLEAEADARDKIARLRERQAILRGKREEMGFKSENDRLKYMTQIKVASIGAQGRRSVAELGFRAKMSELYSDRAQKLATDRVVPSEALAVIESATAPTASRVDTVAALRTAMEKAKYPAPGSTQYDSVQYAMFRALEERDAKLGTNEARTFADQAFSPGVDPHEYMAKVHTTLTTDEAQDLAKKVAREVPGAGGDPNVVLAWEQAGAGIPTDKSTMTSTTTREAGTPSGAPAAAGEADGLDQAIKDLEDYADGLAQQRESLSGGRSRYPRGHSFLLNPNTYTNEEGWSALKRFADRTPEGIDEITRTLATEGTPKRAYDRMMREGGFNDQRGREYVPELVDDGLDVGAWLAQTLSPTRVKDGEWEYEVRADDTITITGTPPGSKAKGRVFTAKDAESPVYKAIRAKIDAAPEMADKVAMAGVFQSQPESVKRLFGNVVELAKRGQHEQAAAVAKAISPDDVRWAYATELEESPVQAAQGILALPESVRGKAGSAAARVLDAPMRSELDATAAQENLRDLGRALKSAQDPEKKARMRGLERQEVATGRESVQAGRDVSGAYAEGRRAAAKVAADVKLKMSVAGQPPNSEAMRAALNEIGGGIDVREGDFSRGFVDQINDDVGILGAEQSRAPLNPPEMVPAGEPGAARPAPGAPLKIGATPYGGRVRGVDLDLEAGGGAVATGTPIEQAPTLYADDDFDALLAKEK